MSQPFLFPDRSNKNGQYLASYFNYSGYSNANLSYTLPSTAYAGEYYARVGSSYGYTGNYGLTVEIKTDTPFLPTVNEEGDYYVIAQTDVNNVLPEGDETNNIIVNSSKVSLTSPTNRPDLTITGSITNNLVLTGSVVPVSWTVTNASLTSNAQSGWFDYVYLSDDNQLDNSDIVLKVKSRSNDLPVLAASGSYSIANENISLPTGVIGTKYLLFVTDNNGDRLESNENNNISAVQIEIAVPDLAVTTIGTVPTTGILGGSIPLAWRVINNGNIAASTNWNDAIYLSSDQTIDNSDTLLSSFSASSQTPLAIGASYDVSRSIVINDVSRLTGQQYLIIKSDVSNVQVDSNRSNNTTIIPITFSAPDLVITETISPTSALLGESVALSWTVKNNSTVAAPASYIHDTVFLSDDQVLDYKDILLARYLATSPNTPLASGSSYVAIQNAFIPSTTVGNKFLLFATDHLYYYGAGNQGETNEDNSVVAVPISLSAPDIVVGNISTVPEILSSQPVELVWTDTNQGNASANGSWIDNIYLSSDDNIGNDIFVGSLSFIGNIAVGQSIERRQTVNVPLNLDGSYRFVVVTNANSQVTESVTGRQNNASIDNQPIQIQINAPDLTVTNIGAIPTSVVLGEQLTLSWQVTNNGDSSANSDWFDRVYLSDDQILDNGDVNIVSYATGSNTPLLVGSSYTVNQNVVIPNTLGASKFLLFVADGSKHQIETNENNNVRAIPISFVAPDLVVSSITPTQETALAGQQVEVAWIVKNQGVAAANGSWIDRVYLSSDNGIGSDIAVGEFSFTGNIAPGQSVNRRQTITVPINLNGSYHFVVANDVYSQLPEGITNDSNNASIGEKPIDIFGIEIVSPNLQVTSITVPPVAFSSQETVVQWQVTNSGNGSTTTSKWYDQVWLSLDQTIDRGDTLLGTVKNVSYLNAGESYLSSLTARLPRGINANYYFLAETDAYFAAAESQESDNVSIGGPTPIQLTPPPDFQVSVVNAPTQGFSGQPLSLSWTVINAGNGENIETAWSDEVFISTDNILDATDQSLGRVEHRGTINPGESYTADNILTSTIINGERVITTKTFDLPVGESGDFFIFVRTDAGNQVYENVFDLNNTAYDTIKVNLTPPPDLEVEFVNAPTVALASHALNINYKVINAGATATPKNSPWSDVFYLSADDQLDSGDLRLGEQYHGEILSAGDSYTVSTSFTLSDTIVGSYYLFAVADGSEIVFELDNNNNKAKKTLPIEILSLPANLTVSAVTAPAIGVSSKAIRIGWKVANQGTGDTAVTSWSDSIVASIDNIIGNGDDRLLAEFAHNDLLNVGGVYSRQELVTVPYDLIGQYQLFVVADYGNNVYEATNEQDNTASKAIAFVRQTADLQVTSVASSVTAVSGDPLNVSWTVQNRGEGQTNSDYWQDKVYLSTDKNISSDDFLLGAINRHGSLGVLAQYNVSLDFDVPVTASGQFYTIVSTDTGSFVLEEPSESNNSLSANDLSTITLRQTDLIFTGITAPAITISGQSINIGWTIQNTGVDATNRSIWYDSFYLSRDQIFDRNNDLYIGSKSHGKTLAAGASYTDFASFDIAQGLSGSFYVFGVTDTKNRIYEANAENNNVTYDVTPTQVVITQPADLVVDSIATATSAVPGQNTSVTYTVVNQGENSALGHWTDVVYVSADGVWDVNDALLGRVEHNGTIISGDSYTGSLTAPLPGVLPDNYQIIVRSDIRNQVIESNEANNGKVSLTPIAVDAERLQLGVLDSSTLAKGESVYYKVEVAEGETLVVTFDSSSSDAFNELYVSRDEVPSRSKFDFASIDPFHPDQRVVIPGTAAGTYYIRAYGNENTLGASPFTIKAELAQFAVFDTTFGKGGNVGNLTVEINGTRFDRSVKVRLLDESGVDRAATSMFYQDETKAFATFNLVGLSAGKYDVVVEKSDGSRVAVNDGLEVVAGGGEKFLTQISGANRVRQNSVFPFAVEWGNDGLNDMVAPLLLVENSIPFGLTTASNTEYSSYTFLGLNSGDGPPGIIRPGQRESRLFFSAANVGSPGSTTYTATVDRVYKDPDGLFDWDSVRAQLQPSNQSDAEFQPVFDRLIAQVGRTNGDYLKMLARNSALLTDSSNNFNNTGALLELEKRKAQAALGTSISGMVQAESIGVDISGRRVIAKNVTTDQLFDTTTLKDGTFIFDGLPVGNYTFAVTSAIVESSSTVTPLTSGQSLSNFKLGISNGAVINGIVKDSANNNLPAEAWIFAYHNDEIVGFSQSGNNGEFSITGLSPGDYIVKAHPYNSSEILSKNVTVAGTNIFKIEISDLENQSAITNSLLNADSLKYSAAPSNDDTFIRSEIKKKLDSKIIQGQYNEEYRSTSINDLALSRVFIYAILHSDDFPPITVNSNEILKEITIEKYFQQYLTEVESQDAIPVEAAALIGGLESVKLYKRYFESTASIPKDEINYNEGSDISNSFKNALTTKKMIKIIEDQALDRIKLLVKDFYPSLQDCYHPAIDRYFDIEKIGVEEQYIHAVANRSTWGYNPIDPREGAGAPLAGSNGFGGLYGGVIPDEKTDDRRDVSGSVRLHIPANSFRGELTFDLKVKIYDTLDFIPGNPYKIKTFAPDGVFANLQTLEANGRAFDVPFTVNFKAATDQRFFVSLVPGGRNCDRPPFGPDNNGPDNTHDFSLVNSSDPNDIIGPQGSGSEKWVSASAPLSYTIRFENDPKVATAPAQHVRVTQKLDSDLDFRTFRVGDFGFGDVFIDVPENRAFYQTRLDLTATQGILVDVTVGIDTTTGEAFWEFSSIDPTTGEAPTDPLQGFLPPNLLPPEGDGFINYSIRAKSTAQTGSIIDAQARIVFDSNEPIDTPAIFNTIDRLAPTSTVNIITPATTTPEFTLNWAGNDDANGSAIASYTVYVSDNNGVYTPWLSDTTLTEASYIGEAGHTYKFYSVATDNAGNIQAPAEAQATIQLAGGTGSIGNFVWTDANGDGFQNQGELGLSNVIVNLYSATTLVATTTTSATGVYNFADIATGEYSLEFAAPNGYLFSAADRGTDEAIDSDANSTTGRTNIFTVNAGENLSWDAGLYQTASISGTNWQDTNGNSTKDADETVGLAGWTVYLDTNENGTLDTGESSTTTDTNGSYSFLNLHPGNYTVAQITKPAWLQTYPRIQVTTTASDIELFTPEVELDVSTAFSTPTKPITSLVDLNGFWQTPRFSNIKGQGLSNVIIDTGIDLDHSIFGADADGNGVADQIVYQYDFADNDADASDRTGHGSHVASIAAQIAPDANLIVLKVFKDNQTGSFTHLEKALQWVNQNVATYNIASVNLSLGDSRNWNTTNPRYGIGDEIAAISAQNVIIAAASGNNFYQFNSAAGVSYPAADPNTIAVGAVWSEDFGGPQKFGNGAIDYSTGADRIASFSQRDVNLLDVFAPGVFVNGANATGGNQSLGGTSQATPFVSGIAVLAQQIALEKLGRKLTVAEFRKLLDDTSTIIQDGDDENDNVANTNLKYPRINLLNLAQGVANFSGSPTNTGVVTPPIIGGSTPSPNVVGTTQILTHSVTLTSGQSLTNQDFGNQPIKSVLNGTNQSDYLTGTADNDTINGLDGNDYLKGGTGNDYLDGGIGKDILDGSDDSDGLDTFAGGAGDDVYGIYNSATVIIENADEGNDTVWTAITYTLPTNIESMYLVGNINGTGNDASNIIVGYGVGSNTIYGLGGNDVIYGGEGSDYLNGGTGSDYLDGGIGNDILDGSDDGNDLNTFAGGAGDDAYGLYNSATVIIENVDGGTDTVWTAVNYTLTDNVENMYLVGDIVGNGNNDNNFIAGYGVGNNTIYGLGGDDVIYGGEGSDYLNGGTDNDYLDGGIGNDILDGSGDSASLDTFAGGTGDDAYGIYNSATVIIEDVEGGSDTVWTAVNYALTDNIENMYLLGDISGTGNDDNNLIIGYGIGNNIIYGLGGNDTISGGLGSDTLFGGAGNDTFILSTTSTDTIGDFGIGSDLLRISASDFGGGLTANVALLTTQLLVGSDITTANSSTQRFIFNTTNGDLFFDADGSSSNFTATKIANLNNISSLRTESFLLG